MISNNSNKSHESKYNNNHNNQKINKLRYNYFRADSRNSINSRNSKNSKKSHQKLNYQNINNIIEKKKNIDFFRVNRTNSFTKKSSLKPKDIKTNRYLSNNLHIDCLKSFSTTTGVLKPQKRERKKI